MDVIVHFPQHQELGCFHDGSRPHPLPERTVKARYVNGSVFAAYQPFGDGVDYWEHWFSVQGSPTLGDAPIKRYMTNHGTYAAREGGREVVISKA